MSGDAQENKQEGQRSFGSFHLCLSVFALSATMFWERDKKEEGQEALALEINTSFLNVRHVKI